MSLPKITQTENEGEVIPPKKTGTNSDSQNPQMLTMLDFKPRWDLGMDLEEKDSWEPELRAWSQDSLGCGPSSVGPGPCRTCVCLLLPASASGLPPSLPPAHRAFCLYWSGSRASKARCSM